MLCQLHRKLGILSATAHVKLTPALISDFVSYHRFVVMEGPRHDTRHRYMKKRENKRSLATVTYERTPHPATHPTPPHPTWLINVYVVPASAVSTRTILNLFYYFPPGSYFRCFPSLSQTFFFICSNAYCSCAAQRNTPSPTPAFRAPFGLLLSFFLLQAFNLSLFPKVQCSKVLCLSLTQYQIFFILSLWMFVPVL